MPVSGGIRSVIIEALQGRDMPRPARRLQLVPSIDSAPIASVAALIERHTGWPHGSYFLCGAKLPNLSLREGPTWRPERKARGSTLGVQSRESSCDFAEGCPLSNRILRDCHVASLLEMTRQVVPWCTSALLPLNILCKAVTDRRYRHNRVVRLYRCLLRAASASPRLPRPLRGLAMTNLKALRQ